MEEELRKVKERQKKMEFILDFMASMGDSKAKLMQVSFKTTNKIHDLLDMLVEKRDEEKIKFVINNFNQMNNMLDDITKALEDGTYKIKIEEN